MAKLSSGKTFVVFVDFQPIVKVFPLNYLLCTVHDGHGLMHCESFPVNSVFCAQPRKFFHSKVLPYTVFQISFNNLKIIPNFFTLIIKMYSNTLKHYKLLRRTYQIRYYNSQILSDYYMGNTPIILLE